MIVDPGPRDLNVLFVSPYPIEPPLHGGAVFMNQTIRKLAPLARVHLICLLDEPREYETNRRLEQVCASAEFTVRWRDESRGIGALEPHAARTFYSADLLWRIHRNIYQRQIDVVQLDYTQLATYAPEFQQIATFLFEHDIYFQSVSRGMKRLHRPLPWLQSGFEYLRALRFERRSIAKFDGVQVCTAENRRYLESYCWNGASIREGFRAGIDVSQYAFHEEGRQPDTLLFVGNFRHEPNRQALEFFTQRVWPLVQRGRPSARLVIAGAQAPPGYWNSFQIPNVEFLGEVDDIREVLERYAIFVCPILSGSGVRVKLLEAFAAGIPVVSTPLGAEGLTGDGGHLALAESAEEFAATLLDLLQDPACARLLAKRARQKVEAEWDIGLMTNRLERHYRQVLRRKLERNEAKRPMPFSFRRSAVESPAEVRRSGAPF
jgi:glycosyltransferase involved in cell wall biosynthesis